MANCPRCLTLVDDSCSFCMVCSKSRIVEGLRAPVPQHPWERPAWRTLIVLLSIWLLVTVGVAFLREAKAVRSSRKFLEKNRAKDAWSLLSPFLEEHPEHEQALLLCGKATLRLDLRSQAKDCIARLGEQSQELTEELEKDYPLALTEASRKLNCDVSGFESLLSWEAELGSNAASGVINGLEEVVRSCATQENYSELSRLGSLMKERGQGREMFEKGFMPLIKESIEKEGRGEKTINMRWLVREALETYPEGEPALEALFKQEPQ